ncbi:hypothetical protein H9P43_008985 [Blastocladiella emersonii ATCC 22665]|nr:hypothetical protein H9P43_008985 [Blastocladiella emersonii ATCC 22665]
MWTLRPASIHWLTVGLEMFNLIYAVVTLAITLSVDALFSRGYSPLDVLTSVPFFLMLLLLSLADIVLVTTCAVHYTELAFGETPLRLFDALYMTVVTVTTVRYGDVTVKNTVGRVVIMLAIPLSLVTISAIASSFIDQTRVYREGGGSYSALGGVSHVVVVRHVSSASVFTSMLHAFFRSETAIPLRVVVLIRHAPLPEVSAFMATPAFRGRVYNLVGSALGRANLHRARVRDAQVVYSLSESSRETDAPTLQTETDDERNMVRSWSVARCAPRVDLYVYVQQPEYERYHAARASEVACVQKLQHALLASNLASRVVAVLFIYLISNATPLKIDSRPWIVQYDDGLGQEVYKIGVPVPVVGLRFHHAAACLFAEFETTPIALRVPLRDARGKVRGGHVVLNPTADGALYTDNELVCIAQSPREVGLVEALHHDQFDASKARYPVLFAETKSEHSIAPIGLSADTVLTRLAASLAHGDAIPAPSRTTCSSSNNRRRRSRSTPNNFPDCHLDPRPPRRVEEVTIASFADADPRGARHIVVLASNAHRFRFLCTRRAAHLGAADLQWVVVVIPSLPHNDDFRFLAPFPRVLYMQGNARRRRDLLCANLPAAARVVVLAHRASDNPVLVDLQAILVRHLAVATAAQFAVPGRPAPYTVVELSESASTNVLAPVNDLVQQQAVARSPRIKLRTRDSRETLVNEIAAGQSLGAVDGERPPLPASLAEATAAARRPRASSAPRSAPRILAPRLRGFSDPHFASGEAFCGDLRKTVLAQHLVNPTVLDLARLFASVRNRADRVVAHAVGVWPAFLSTVPLPAGGTATCSGTGCRCRSVCPARRVLVWATCTFVYTAPCINVVLRDSDLMCVEVQAGGGEGAGGVTEVQGR